MASQLPPLPDLETVRSRLAMIFPEGTPNRNYCVRETAVRTVFVMLYVGAVESSGRFLRPNQVTRMTDEQARRVSGSQRHEWAEWSLKPLKGELPGRWYADNTREPIRDESLRMGLNFSGAVIEREDLPTTSSKPRHALTAEFAALFDPKLKGRALEESIAAWQADNLSPTALARIERLVRGTTGGSGGVLVTYPSGETRRLAKGLSSEVTKAVVEEFAPRFLVRPHVLFMSESGRKVVERDQRLAKAIGLRFPPHRLLPDIVLVDLCDGGPLLVFVEVVATDGAIDEQRRSQLADAAAGAGFRRGHLAFVTAFLDRSHPAYRKHHGHLAWGTFAWFMAEPEQIIHFRDHREPNHQKLIRQLSPGAP